MTVEMHEYKIAEAPQTLETVGLGPCIGVALIHAGYGFLLHSVDVIMERDRVIDPFFTGLKSKIPSSDRSATKPIVAGGCLNVFTGAPDPENHDRIRACRNEILIRLADSGFISPIVRWGKPYHNQSLFVDITEHVIILETMDESDPDSAISTEKFAC